MNKSAALLSLAARRLERAEVQAIIDGPAVAREMWQWSEDFSNKTTRRNHTGPLTREEFMSHVDVSQVGTGCWLWRGVTDRHGYGRLSRIVKSRMAHNFGYQMLKGPIPPGCCIDHLCRNPRCVNAEHLEAVSLAENVMRGMSPAAQCARQTHCKNGHPFEGANLGFRKRSDGRDFRYCIICAKEKHRRANERRRACRYAETVSLPSYQRPRDWFDSADRNGFTDEGMVS